MITVATEMTETAPSSPASPATADGRWQAVLARDRRQDGAFVFAVRTTGVFCRPSCPARRPRPENVRFFDKNDDARRAGFRACRRCHPDDADPRPAWVRRVCRTIDESVAEGVR